MYIQKKPAAAILRLIIGTFSLVLMWYLFSQFGVSAFRLFPTWVLIISALYFLISALLTAISMKKFTGKTFWPMLEGMLLINYLLMSGLAITSAQHHFYLPELDGWLVWCICLILPLLIFADWLLFMKKGFWRVMYPFYWLALPVCYAATIIFTNQILPDNIFLRYPLEIFNYLDFGLWAMLGWMLVIVLLVLSTGYILYLADFTASGKLAKKIVLPHLQVVEVDDHGNVIKTETTEPAKKPPIASEKPAQQSQVNSTNKPKSAKTHSEPEIIKIQMQPLESKNNSRSKDSNSTSKTNSSKTQPNNNTVKKSKSEKSPNSNRPKSKPAKVTVHSDEPTSDKTKDKSHKSNKPKPNHNTNSDQPSTPKPDIQRFDINKDRLEKNGRNNESSQDDKETPAESPNIASS